MRLIESATNMSEKERSSQEQTAKDEVTYKAKYEQVVKVLSALDLHAGHIEEQAVYRFMDDPRAVESLIFFSKSLREDITFYMFQYGNLDNINISIPTHLIGEAKSLIRSELLKRDGETIEIPQESLGQRFESLTYKETYIPGIYLQTRVLNQDGNNRFKYDPTREFLVGERFFR